MSSSPATKKRACCDEDGTIVASSASADSVLVPSTYNRSMVHLRFADGPKAIEWYKTVLGVTERMRVETSDKKHIMHAELQLGDTVIMMSDMPSPAGMEPGPSNSSLYTYVADVDAAYATALKHGSTGKTAPHDAFYGDRMASFKDPFGNHWVVARPNMNKSPEEIKNAIETQAKVAAEGCDNKMAVEEKREAPKLELKDAKAELARWPKMSYIHHTKPADRQTPKIVSESEWVKSMADHVLVEKALTHHKDYVTAVRQQLPWTEVPTNYVFEDLHGSKVNFLEFFSNPKSDDLIIQTIMLPASHKHNNGCPFCSFWTDNVSGNLYVLQQKMNVAVVAKGGPQLISEIAKKRGWRANLPLFSAQSNTYLEDIGMSITPAQFDEFKKLIEEAKGDGEAALAKLKLVNPNHPNAKIGFGSGCPFLMPSFGSFEVFHLDRQSKKVYKTFTYDGRGSEALNGGLGLIDMLPYGRESFEASL